MGFFVKKKEEHKKFIGTSNESEPKQIAELTPVLPIPQETEQTQFAPLFVKVEKYYDILNSMNELRNTLDSLKGVLINLKKVESMEEKNMHNLHEVVGNLSSSLESLDSKFLRPPSFHPETPQQMFEADQLDDVLKDLKLEVGKLKGELKEMV